MVNNLWFIRDPRGCAGHRQFNLIVSFADFTLTATFRLH
jgi:hypothetical protein